jgi:hypothetical protein
VPILAYIGSGDSRESFDAGDAGPIFFVADDLTVCFFGSRFLLQTLLLPDAISAIVRPDSTDVMFSATTSLSQCKKKPRRAGLFLEWNRGQSACLGDVSGLRSLLTLNYLELDLIALSERFETGSTDRAEMDKDVRATLA